MRRRFKGLDDLFAEPAASNDRPLRGLSHFDMGVCPGCRGLRVTASLRCGHCGSTKPVTADA